MRLMLRRYLWGCSLTQIQALTQALILALIAPTDEQSEKAKNLAVDLSPGLTADPPDQCQAEALNSIDRLGV